MHIVMQWNIIQPEKRIKHWYILYGNELVTLMLHEGSQT